MIYRSEAIFASRYRHKPLGDKERKASHALISFRTTVYSYRDWNALR